MAGIYCFKALYNIIVEIKKDKSADVFILSVYILVICKK